MRRGSSPPASRSPPTEGTSCLEVNSPEIWEKNSALDEKGRSQNSDSSSGGGKGWDGGKKRFLPAVSHCLAGTAFTADGRRTRPFLSPTNILLSYIIYASLRYITDHWTIHLLPVCVGAGEPQRHGPALGW